MEQLSPPSSPESDNTKMVRTSVLYTDSLSQTMNSSQNVGSTARDAAECLINMSKWAPPSPGSPSANGDNAGERDPLNVSQQRKIRQVGVSMVTDVISNIACLTTLLSTAHSYCPRGHNCNLSWSHSKRFASCFYPRDGSTLLNSHVSNVGWTSHLHPVWINSSGSNGVATEPHSSGISFYPCPRAATSHSATRAAETKRKIPLLPIRELQQDILQEFSLESTCSNSHRYSPYNYNY